MEKEKYFIPEISDLFVGYECEIINYASNNYNKDKSTCKWNKFVLKKEHLFSSYDGSSFLETCVSCLNFEELRVPFLTKEQIENEGYIFRTNNRSKFVKSNNTEEWGLDYNYNTNMLFIEKGTKLEEDKDFYYPYEGSNYIFVGKCRCINEFRTICKLLEI